MPERSYLLDTNIVIWLDRDRRRVPRAVLDLIENDQITLWVSTVSFWELAIKQAVGKIDPGLRIDPAMKTYGFAELTISSKYASAVRELPMLHGDPFDRMLVAQAMVEGVTLVTADRRLARYPVPTVQV